MISPHHLGPSSDAAGTNVVVALRAANGTDLQCSPEYKLIRKFLLYEFGIRTDAY